MPFDHRTFLQHLTTRPGVYQMMDTKGRVIYVGKARHLKNRVSSYFRANQLDPKTVALVQQVAHIEITIAASENEALLLESNLIKRLKPRYNILLRDDKSYPYLFLSGSTDFPRLQIHRGPRREKGEYFGPYPSAHAVHETLDLLQRLFKIRQCSDVFFKTRSRPCLQYQIKRCTAPCVNYVSKEAYQQDVNNTRLFLQGKNNVVIQLLIDKMNQAADSHDYEVAAQYRDQIAMLRQVHEQQVVVRSGEGDVDILACVSELQTVAISVLSIRAGRWIGSRAYFPSVPAGSTPTDALAAFLPQYYLSDQRGSAVPKQILINHELPEQQWLEAAFSEQWGKKVNISVPERGQGKQWLVKAQENARHALQSHLIKQSRYAQCLQQLQQVLNMAELPERLECFDISHTQGEATIASCVVFGVDGPLNNEYRRFRIEGITAGDDYAAMRQALTRRYAARKAHEQSLPDILVIDGGKGQLGVAQEVLEELQITDLVVLGIAKGPERKPGEETILVAGGDQPLPLTSDSPALHVLQRIRDEAHRFAITGHRRQRAKARVTSRLEGITGIGPQRRRALLEHFGGLQGVLKASVDELAKVPGIHSDLAKRLYEELHG